MAQIELYHVSYTYPMAKKPAVSEITLSIDEGEFVLLCGMTGSGKSTLLRLMKKGLCEAGKRQGNLFFDGIHMDELPERRAVCEIGFVFQDADSQIVMDTVWHELAFSLENLALSPDIMRARIAEMAAFFGLESMMEKPVSALSGGEKKILCLASVLILRPKVLLLDEPISALDPIAAREFLEIVQRIHSELGTTIVMVEHRLTEIIPLATKIVYLQDGKIRDSGAVDSVCQTIWNTAPALLPDFMKIYFEHPVQHELPKDVRTARKLLQHISVAAKNRTPYLYEQQILKLKGIDFYYEDRGPEVLRGLELSVYEGESLAILGGNGAGKSTLLKLIARILSPIHGSIYLYKKKLKSYKKEDLYRTIGYLAQNPRLYFTQDTVQEEWNTMVQTLSVPEEQSEKVLSLFSLKPLFDHHPSELSGGQQELLALALVLLSNPQVLLFDEPTNGLDAQAKQKLIAWMDFLHQQGKTIIFVTHDMEFAARAATRCVMLFGREITASAAPQEFFTEHYFYTTALRRVLREQAPGALCAEDLIVCEK